MIAFCRTLASAAHACLALAVLHACNTPVKADHPNVVVSAEPPPTDTEQADDATTPRVQAAPSSPTCPRYLTARRHVLQKSTSTQSLVLVDIETGKMRSLAAEPRSGNVAWSPNGAYVAIPAPQQGVLVVEVATLDTRHLPNATTDYRLTGDGRFLLYDKRGKTVLVEVASGSETPLPTGTRWLASHPSEPLGITQDGECTYLVDVSGLQPTRVIDRVGPGSAAARFSPTGDQLVVADPPVNGVIPKLRAGATTNRVPANQCGELAQQCKPFDCMCGDAPCSSFHRSDRMHAARLLGWDDRFDAPLLLRTVYDVEQPGVWLRAVPGFPDEFFPLMPAQLGVWRGVSPAGPGTFLYWDIGEATATPNPLHVASDSGRRFERWLEGVWTYYFNFGVGSDVVAYTDQPGEAPWASIYVATVGGQPRKVVSATSEPHREITYSEPTLQSCSVR